MRRHVWTPLVLSLALLGGCEGFDVFNTYYDEDEKPVSYKSKAVTPPSQSIETLTVMNWNIKFGGGRLDFFFDCHGDRVLMEKEEVSFGSIGWTFEDLVDRGDAGQALPDGGEDRFSFGGFLLVRVERGEGGERGVDGRFHRFEHLGMGLVVDEVALTDVLAQPVSLDDGPEAVRRLLEVGPGDVDAAGQEVDAGCPTVVEDEAGHATDAVPLQGNGDPGLFDPGTSRDGLPVEVDRDVAMRCPFPEVDRFRERSPELLDEGDQEAGSKSLSISESEVSDGTKVGEVGGEGGSSICASSCVF